MYWGILQLGIAVGHFVTAAAEDKFEFTKLSNESLQWGPYRPNLYFGIRPMLPKSLLTGLLWARSEDFASMHNDIRYTCEQHDDMAGYGWDAYDPRSGGFQTIHDKGNGIDIETHFVKFEGGHEGWGARIRGVPRIDAEPMIGSQDGVAENLKTSVWFVVGLEGTGDISVDHSAAGSDIGIKGDVIFQGQTDDLGAFKLVITESGDKVRHPKTKHSAYQKRPLDRSQVHSLEMPEEAIWQAKTIVLASLKTSIEAYIEEYTQEKMPPPWQTFIIQHRPTQGNMHLVQKSFEGPFEFDVIYNPASNKIAKTSADLTKAIETSYKNFDKKYLEVLGPTAPFKDDKYVKFSKALFSNLIGGIGYFYGDQLIDRSYAPEYDEDAEGFWEDAAEARSRNTQNLEGPYELFTSVPSRPFFPRGFLWDEGFHLLPILQWDTEIAMRILTSWFNTMDEDGWMPREQILGPEARSKVPPEFQVQYPHYANPPTFYLTIEALLDKVEGQGSEPTPFADTKSVNVWLKQLYPLLQRNYDWYRKTQKGDLKTYDRPATDSKEAYRWRGRTPQHILTSGLDDYPRAQPPHPGELHTDLISWMGLMSRAMARIATFVGEAQDAARYNKIAEAIARNTDTLHWSKQHKTYCDVSVDDFEEGIHVCHKGYVSIFPFMTGLLGAKHEHLKDILDLIADESELWSPFGIRSLSKKDELYGSGENYWRSPVWMNMNYLIVKNLYKIGTQKGPQQQRARTMYGALRKNLVDTVYRSWADTGFAWEQYNPETGVGQRTRHFTGWTSLIVQILNMPDLSNARGQDHGEL